MYTSHKSFFRVLSLNIWAYIHDHFCSSNNYSYTIHSSMLHSYTIMRPILEKDYSTYKILSPTSFLLCISNKYHSQPNAYKVKPVLSSRSKRGPKLVFNTYHLMQVKSIAECSKGSILQYFRPSLSYHLSLRSLFCLFSSECLRQVLLYSNNNMIINQQTRFCYISQLRVATSEQSCPTLH